MAQLHSLYLKKETIQTLLDVLTKKQEKGIELTISVNDEFNQFNQNVSAFVSQTKEQREQNKPKYYVGNGRTFWSTNNDHPKPEAKSEAQAVKAEVVEDDLPF